MRLDENQQIIHNILYLSYDGMLEPLGESQVLGYLTKLARDPNLKYTLLSFEKKKDWSNLERRRALSKKLNDSGIHWIPLRYHAWPPVVSTLADIVTSFVISFIVCLRANIHTIHARSDVPAVTAYFLKRLLGVRFIFDMRGFWADERADAGQWSRTSLLYKIIKRFEKSFLLTADAVVSLTEAGVKEMATFPYLKNHATRYFVIPTCADLERFTPAARTSKDATFCLGHVGSIGNWYLFDEAILFFIEFKKIKPSAKFLIINRGEHARIKTSLEKFGLTDDSVELRSAEHDEMPALLHRLDAAVFFIRPLYSKKASAPTKLAELLGSGIPCVVNSGIGDLDDLFATADIGVALKSLNTTEFERGTHELLRLMDRVDTPLNCRQKAVENFSVAEGTHRYRALYRSILPTSKFLNNANL